jgi:tetratricopeptide (TPR) repeat protein
MPRLPSRTPVSTPDIALRRREAERISQAQALHNAGRLPDAHHVCEEVLRENPRHPQALAILGTIALQLRQPARAIELLDTSLRILEAQPLAHNNRGIALCDCQQFEAALADFDRAIALGFSGARKNKANALTYAGRYAEALALFTEEIAAYPDDASLYHNQVPALMGLGDPDAAMRSLDRAIALQPDYADAYYHRAELRLLLGDFASGWREYEWRWRVDQPGLQPRGLPQPLWLGEQDIAGKTILLYAEQGFGDTLQLCRYAPLVAAKGARVVLEVPDALTRLMESLDGVSQVVRRGDELPPADFQTPLMSLPLALGTMPDTIPQAVPYLSADAALAASWQQRLGERQKPRVGLVWFGSMTAGLAHIKSMSFDDVLGLTDLDMAFYALQKPRNDQEGIEFQRHGTIVDLGGALTDFAETAAVIANLDLVVTVDTAAAHLAGALGKPVWVLLSHLQDWRWMRTGSATPWYPTARLFRQDHVTQDWGGVIADVRQALRQRFQ